MIIFNETEYRADGSFKAHVTNHRQNIGHSSGLRLVEIISIGTCACASLLITTVFIWKYFVCKRIILNTFQINYPLPLWGFSGIIKQIIQRERNIGRGPAEQPPIIKFNDYWVNQVSEQFFQYDESRFLEPRSRPAQASPPPPPCLHINTTKILYGNW